MDSASREEVWYTLKGLKRFRGILETAVEAAEFETQLETQDGE